MKYYFYVFSLIMSFQAAANEAVTFNDDQIANTGIELGTPVKVDQSLTESLPAKVVIPNKSQQVMSAPQDGVVEILYVAEGDKVIVGQALAEINSPQLLTAQNDYLQSLSRLLQLRQEMSRDNDLFEEGIIAERRYRQTQSSYQQELSAFSMYKKSLQLAGMNLDAIKQLDKTRVLNSHLTLNAMSNGVVMKQFAMIGERLSAADPIYRVAQLSKLWLEIHVPLDMVDGVAINDRIQTCEKTIRGKVIAIGRQVHPVDQGVLVRAEIIQNTDQLTPGEFVQTCFVQQSDKTLFALPRSAISRHQNQTFVFIKTENGFVNQLVEVINDSGEQVIVTADFSAQQQIVIKGTATIKAAWLGMGGE